MAWDSALSVEDKNDIACCVDGDVSRCKSENLPGERVCDSALRIYCTTLNPTDPRCSCFKKPDELADPEKRKEWVCFSRDCYGPEKLILREWQDDRCPDYVSCRSQIRLQGNLIALPAAVNQEQDCGGADNKRNTRETRDFRTDEVKNAEKNTQAWILWLRRNSLWFILAGLFLFGFLISVIASKKRPAKSQPVLSDQSQPQGLRIQLVQT